MQRFDEQQQHQQRQRGDDDDDPEEMVATKPTTKPPGWGIDAPLENRPGVPHEFDPPMPFGNMSLGAPPQQIVGRPTAHSRTVPLTQVYGTSLPPRGLSGVLRRLAYRMPSYRPRRWMLLMLADRIDVIEHNLFPSFAVIGAIALGLLGVRALARR